MIPTVTANSISNVSHFNISCVHLARAVTLTFFAYEQHLELGGWASCICGVISIYCINVS